jgi:hypothetical protein
MIIERIVCRLCGEAFDDVNAWWWHHLHCHSDKTVGPLALALHFARPRQSRARRLEALLDAEGEGWVEVVRARGAKRKRARGGRK